MNRGRYFSSSFVLAVIAFNGLCTGQTQSHRWSAADDDITRAMHSEQKVAGQPAILLDSAKGRHRDLSSLVSADDIGGPLTIRVVFRLTKAPTAKCPLVSKWELKDGLRAFELGVFSSGVVFFDISPSGNWDVLGREIVSKYWLGPGEDYCLAAVFEPNRRIQIFANGELIAETEDSVPEKIHWNSTPIWLGAQPPGGRNIDALVSQVILDRSAMSSKEILDWAESLGLKNRPHKIQSPMRSGKLDLPRVREQVLKYCDDLQVAGKPYGVIRERRAADSPVGLYPSTDVAWIRVCMGENLRETLTDRQRQEWIKHINSFARDDGSYYCARSGHSLQHANGMVIGALAVLGGRQPHRVELYDEFNTRDRIVPWLESIRWERQWGASHLFWGGMHCYSLSKSCRDEWLDDVFEWLDQNLDPKTGWWRKGVPQAGRRIEVLGGAAHIWPIYQHHRRRFPYPTQIIDEILSMQKEDGAWISYCNYMELDALYGLAYMRSLAPNHRKADIDRAVALHGKELAERFGEMLFRNPSAHQLLAGVGAIGLLQQLAPADYPDTVQWSDIFSDRRFYRTDLVEAE